MWCDHICIPKCFKKKGDCTHVWCQSECPDFTPDKSYYEEDAPEWKKKQLQEWEQKQKEKK